MKYKLLGKSGLRVSELCLGAMTFGEDWGSFLRGASKEECKKIFDLFVDAGGNFIDTANNYQNGTSEKYVGEFIAPEREKFVLATKYTLTTNSRDPNASGSHRKNLVQSVEASLKRLNTHYIDFLWVHAWDYMTPVEEVMRSLDDMIRCGKVLYVGMSDAPAWIVARANTISELRGWSPLGGGVLSGKYNDASKEKRDQKRFETNNPMTAAFVNERNLMIAKEVQRIAKETNKTPSQVALSWIRHQRERGVIVPIVGARTQDQLKDNLGSLDLELSSDQLEALNEISKIDLGFPHNFLSSDMIKTLIYGDVFSRIDFHRGF